MNKLGYDVVTIGNHDLDYGQEALRDHIKGMPSTKFVITNANLSPTLETVSLRMSASRLKARPFP